MALFLFDTELVVSHTLPDNQELSLALGSKTIVHSTLSQSLSFIGLSASGAIPQDKMVVCFSNVTFTSSFSQTFVHEATSPAPSNPAFRFRNAGLANVTGGAGIGAIWYEYYATLQRWIMIGKTA